MLIYVIVLPIITFTSSFTSLNLNISNFLNITMPTILLTSHMCLYDQL